MDRIDAGNHVLLLLIALAGFIGGVVVNMLRARRERARQATADEQRRLSEEKFTGIVSIASDAIISIDPQQRIINFNHGAETIFGYTADEAIGQRIEMLIPERFRAKHEQDVRRFGASQTVARRMGERSEITGLRKNGEVFPAEASISKLKAGNDFIYTVVLRDITDRKRYEATQHFLAEAGTALMSSIDTETILQSVARLIVPELADWSIIYTRADDGRLIRVAVAHRSDDIQQQLQAVALNRAADRSEHPVSKVFTQGNAVLIENLTKAQVSRMAETPEHESLLQSLGVRSAMFVPMTARGEITGAIGFFSGESARVFDSNDLALAEEVARRAGLAIDNARLYRVAQSAIQARDDVLAVVSHDLGNPLSAIRIGTTLLLSSIPPAERETGGWKHIVGIRNSAEQMERLIRDLLEVKRIEAGQLSIERGRVAVGPLVNEAIELLTPIAEGQNVKLTSALQGDVGAVYADHERLLQIFSNLVGNAVKFTPAGGEVTIGAEVNHENVVLSVTDTGIGISEEDAAHVFDRYWQAQSRRKGKQGIGLGLVIVKGIVEAHGGNVWVESNPGTGSAFRFTVPIWKNQILEE